MIEEREKWRYKGLSNDYSFHFYFFKLLQYLYLIPIYLHQQNFGLLNENIIII